MRGREVERVVQPVRADARRRRSRRYGRVERGDEERAEHREGDDSEQRGVRDGREDGGGGVGVEGEMCIGGEGWREGTMGRAEMTAERFVPTWIE